MNSAKRLSIIVPSFRDERILEAIASIRAIDDVSAIRIVVIDGGSPEPLVARIAAVLTDDDILVSERDKGIFDGLNKGLDQVDTDYMGWLGSDDLYSGEVKASEVIGQLEDADLYITSMAFFRGDRIRRITHSWPASKGLVTLGLHNPHYGTFGRSGLLKSERFAIDDPISDQIYFFRIFDKKPRVAWTKKVGILAGEGGFSNSSYGKALALNRLVFTAIRRHRNIFAAIVGVAAKVGYKGSMRLWFKLRRITWPQRFPIAHRAMLQARQPGRP
ncbi:glycosyltransferase [Allosphingosinicella sp.]|uniref:glycosyltransferase n=1 Tax=Allosphingosinicella sp. TaxID=2823234 RepID=UPI003783FEA4